MKNLVILFLLSRIRSRKGSGSALTKIWGSGSAYDQCGSATLKLDNQDLIKVPKVYEWENMFIKLTSILNSPMFPHFLVLTQALPLPLLLNSIYYIWNPGFEPIIEDLFILLIYPFISPFYCAYIHPCFSEVVHFS